MALVVRRGATVTSRAPEREGGYHGQTWEVERMSIDPAARGARAAWDMREDGRRKRERELDDVRALMQTERRDVRAVIVDECRWGPR